MRRNEVTFLLVAVPLLVVALVLAGCGQRSEVQSVDLRPSHAPFFIKANINAVIPEKDQWGTDLLFKPNGEIVDTTNGVIPVVELWSAGPDKRFDTTDDVVPWSANNGLNHTGEPAAGSPSG